MYKIVFQEALNGVQLWLLVVDLHTHICSGVYLNQLCVKSMHETIIYVSVRHGNELSGGRDTTNRKKKLE